MDKRFSERGPTPWGAGCYPGEVSYICAILGEEGCKNELGELLLAKGAWSSMFS